MVRKASQSKKAPKNGASRSYTSAELAAIAKAKVRPTGFQNWDPSKDGDHIAGRLTDIHEAKGQNGPFMSYQIEGPDGRIGLPSGVVMQREMAAIKARVGMHVAICYRGKVKGKKGRPARLFTVVKVDD